MCELTLTPTTAVLLAAVGCWSIAFGAALSTCVSQPRCRAHRRCRRCIAAAATRAAPSGFAGLALALIGAGLWPSQSMVVAGGSLVLGGLAGMSQADWRVVAMLVFRLAARRVSRAIKALLGDGANDERDQFGGGDSAS